MNNTINLPEENPKRAAFKRFSQMGVAGLAVMSLSAFTNVSAKELPATVCNISTEKKDAALQNRQNDKPFAVNDEWIDYADSPPPPEEPYSNSGYYDFHYNDFYSDHSNHANYSNNYADTCE